MVNAQVWLNEKYSTVESKEDIAELNINDQELEGELRIEGFSNLKKLDCCRNKIDKLSISGSPELTHFACFDNFNLKEIEFQDELSKLTWVDFNNNGLENLNFLSQINSENLKWLFLANNNITENFSVFSNFTNLQELRIGNEEGLAPDEENPKKKNTFIGNLSLNYLKKCNKLRYLNIPKIEVGEDIGRNLEKLPDSLEIIWCDSKEVDTQNSIPILSQRTIEEELESCKDGMRYDIWTWKRDNKDFKNLIDKNEKITSVDRFKKRLDDYKVERVVYRDQQGNDVKRKEFLRDY